MCERHRDLGLHVARIVGCAALYAWSVLAARPLFALVAALGAYFATFSLAHDLVHGTLGLRPWLRRLLMSAAAQGLFVAGAQMRFLHLRHHARPFAAGDLEGTAVRLGLARAFVLLPALFVAMRAVPLAFATGRKRRLQMCELLGNVCCLVLCLAAPALRFYAVVAIGAGLLVPLWAGYLPHRAPPWLLRVARVCAAVGSPVATALAYHDLHHARPALPVSRLHRFADR